MKRTHDAATCNATQVQVEYEEVGGYVALKVAPCTRCRQPLCPSCDFAACDGCGNVFCSDYLMHEEDGSEPDLRSCRECTAMGEAPEQELPLLPAMVSCVACGSAERTVQADTFFVSLKWPLYCETWIPMLGVA